MKRYEVQITEQAESEADKAYIWIKEQSPDNASGWWNGLVDAILSLEELPERCPFAPESEWFDEEIRQLLYGKRTGCYRILYTIQERSVVVLHIRHAAMRFLEP